MALTYAQLVAAIYSYLETDANGMSATAVETVVRQAEERIYMDVSIPTPEKTSTGAFTVSNRFLSLPTDCVAVNHITVINGTTYVPLDQKESSFMREAYPSSATTGVPRYYAYHDDNTLAVAPTPASAYAVEMNYFSKPASIVTTSTSWLGQNAESVLLSACLLEGYVHLKGEADLFDVYQKRYNDALSALGYLGEGKQKTDTYRTKPPTTVKA